MMVRNRTGDVSPPQAYAKYLDDFEECDEIQAGGGAGAASSWGGYGTRFQESYAHASSKQYGAGPSRTHAVQRLAAYDESRDETCSPGLHYQRDYGQHSAGEMREKSSRTRSLLPAPRDYGSKGNTTRDGQRFLQREGRSSAAEQLIDLKKAALISCSKLAEGPTATYQQLEERLHALQFELNMLEEEGKKPRSSVVVPKKSRLNFGSCTKAAFNVGGDFIVKVGNSPTIRGERVRVLEETRSQRRGSGELRSNRTRIRGNHWSQNRKKKAMFPFRDARAAQKIVGNMSSSAGSEKRNESAVRGHRAFGDGDDVRLLDISDDDDGISTAASSVNARAVSLSDIEADEISSTDETGSERSANRGKMLAVEDVSSDSDGGDVESLNESDGNAKGNAKGSVGLSRISEISESEDEPLELVSTVDSYQLVDISDDDLIEDDVMDVGKAAEPVLLRESLSYPHVFNNIPVLSHCLQNKSTLLPLSIARDPQRSMAHAKYGCCALNGEEQRKYLMEISFMLTLSKHDLMDIELQ